MDFEDRLVTVTPEGISLEVVLAGLGSRFIAFAVDFSLQMIALAVFLFVVVSAFHGTVTTTSGLVAGGALSVFGLLDFLGYFVVCEMAFSGRSLGKKMVGLRVVRVGGQPVGFWSSLLRNVLRLIDMQIGITYLVGGVLILTTTRNQRLGDLLAGTVVVRDRLGTASPVGAAWSSAAGFAAPGWRTSPRPADTSGLPSAPTGGLPPGLAHWDVSAVPGADIELARTFLAHRGGYTGEARAKLAYELAGRIWPLVAGPTGPMHPEQFLEAVLLVKSRRS